MSVCQFLFKTSLIFLMYMFVLCFQIHGYPYNHLRIQSICISLTKWLSLMLINKCQLGCLIHLKLAFWNCDTYSQKVITKVLWLLIPLLMDNGPDNIVIICLGSNDLSDVSCQAVVFRGRSGWSSNYLPVGYRVCESDWPLGQLLYLTRWSVMDKFLVRFIPCSTWVCQSTIR